MMVRCVRHTVIYTLPALLFGFLFGPLGVVHSSCQPASFDKDLISEKTQTHPTFSRSLSFIYDKRSAALHDFRQELEPIFLLPSHLPMLPPGSPIPPSSGPTAGSRKLSDLPPKSDGASESPSTTRGLTSLKVFFRGNQWCSARYTRVCRVYPLQSE